MPPLLPSPRLASSFILRIHSPALAYLADSESIIPIHPLHFLQGCLLAMTSTHVAPPSHRRASEPSPHPRRAGDALHLPSPASPLSATQHSFLAVVTRDLSPPYSLPFILRAPSPVLPVPSAPRPPRPVRCCPAPSASFSGAFSSLISYYPAPAIQDSPACCARDPDGGRARHVIAQARGCGANVEGGGEKKKNRTLPRRVCSSIHVALRSCAARQPSQLRRFARTHHSHGHAFASQRTRARTYTKHPPPVRQERSTAIHGALRLGMVDARACLSLHVPEECAFQLNAAADAASSSRGPYLRPPAHPSRLPLPPRPTTLPPLRPLPLPLPLPHRRHIGGASEAEEEVVRRTVRRGSVLRRVSSGRLHGSGEAHYRWRGWGPRRAVRRSLEGGGAAAATTPPPPVPATGEPLNATRTPAALTRPAGVPMDVWGER
ncbi:hypothetical protein DFH09DRAFT_1505209 [Mycena vulgaris]|nr:hypothetical protein DFH09DRAFT_1505209 [Mycena vulgaris]